MKVSVKNLGVIKQAELTLGDMTVIYGKNDTGKTYLSYALYGFLDAWQGSFQLDLPRNTAARLVSEGSVTLDLQPHLDKAKQIIHLGCKDYSRDLSRVFAAPRKHFAGSRFEFDVGAIDIEPLSTFNHAMGTASQEFFLVTKEADSRQVTITLSARQGRNNLPLDLMAEMISEAMCHITFGQVLPNHFIATAERIGAAMFGWELSLLRSLITEAIRSGGGSMDSLKLLPNPRDNYSLPVRANAAVMTELDTLTEMASFINDEHPELLQEFRALSGGDYSYDGDNEYSHIPQGSKASLRLPQSSRAACSLMMIGFYLRHWAMPGDLLIIDEPEAGLHPQKQRQMARFLARLTNIGFKVFITTRSDYIIKELNTLLMLSGSDPQLQACAEREGYRRPELLAPRRVKAYVSKQDSVRSAYKPSRCMTFAEAEVDECHGIKIDDIDDAANDINRIQDDIRRVSTH